ncbi:MAG TPA: PilZ domain-containing protein [Thermoanaerobaculia bacterium]|nr:PilZ domain-containing protein [Thermoanaerobaculia bacterium]
MPHQPFDLSSIPRDSRRVPIAARVTFKFERFSGFISEYSANISPTGMFITANNPEPPGGVLDFEFQLGDGFEIIQGKGEVVWTRAVAEGPHRPAGMGIRFLDLSEGSKDLIYRIVDQYIQDGGTPFDVTLRPPDPVQPFPMTPVPMTPVVAIPADPDSPFPDLPDSGVLPPVDSSAWLPPLDGLDPMPVDDDFPPFMPPLPPMDDPEPPRPTVNFGGYAASAAQPRKSRALPLAALGLLLALAAAAYLFRDTLTGLLGPDEEARSASATSPAGPSAERASAPPPQETPESVTPITEEDLTPLPEVVRRREEEAATAPAPAPVATTTPSAPTGPALTVLEKITFEQASGGTDVILWGDGAIRPEVYSQSRIGDPPRELIVLTGISRQFPSPRVAVGTGEVKQVRVGYHQKAGGNELHIVIDLADPKVQVTRIEARDQHLRIHLQKQ